MAAYPAQLHLVDRPVEHTQLRFQAEELLKILRHKGHAQPFGIRLQEEAQVVSDVIVSSLQGSSGDGWRRQGGHFSCSLSLKLLLICHWRDIIRLIGEPHRRSALSLIEAYLFTCSP